MPKINENTRATIEDVARRAGVSTATVSRVVNKTGPVAEATAKRVRTVVAELNYTPNAAARGLASRKTNTIGLIVREISGHFFQPMLRGIETGVRESGFDLLIHSTHILSGDDNPLPNYPLSEHNADGLLVFTDSVDDGELRRLHRLQFPIVLLHQSPPQGLRIPCVTIENKTGARCMVDYLIEVRGFRRIAFLCGPEGAEDSYWREQGYRESLEAHGIAFDPTLVDVGGFDEQQAYRLTQHWLARGRLNHVEAIFAGDDDSALGVLNALRDAGIRVPEDIALVGFDDVYLARHLTPPLTTVRSPIEMAASEAVRQLVRLIRTGEADQLTLLPTELVVRRSCGCC